MNTTQLIQRAEALMSQGNPEEAGKIYEELCRMEQLTAAERGVALFGLGTCLFLHESYAAASLQLRESWELLIASLGMEDPLTTRTMVLLSRTLIALGDLESGMEIGRGALKNLVKLYGQDADQAATAAFFLSSGAYQFGRLAEARGADTAGFTGMGKDLWACLASGRPPVWTHWGNCGNGLRRKTGRHGFPP